MSHKFWSRDRGTSVAQGPAVAEQPITEPGCPTGEVRRAVPGVCAQDLLAGLSPRVIRVLAGLNGAPRSVAEATIQLLPFGSRAGLEANDLAVRESDAQGNEFLRLTPAAYQAMAEAAAQEDGTTEAATELERRLDRARQRYISRRCYGEHQSG
jgi:hypothetical protein